MSGYQSGHVSWTYTECLDIFYGKRQGGVASEHLLRQGEGLGSSWVQFRGTATARGHSKGCWPVLGSQDHLQWAVRPSLLFISMETTTDIKIAITLFDRQIPSYKTLFFNTVTTINCAFLPAMNKSLHDALAKICPSLGEPVSLLLMLKCTTHRCINVPQVSMSVRGCSFFLHGRVKFHIFTS